MTHPAGETETGNLRIDFERRVRLEFHGSRITSDAGLLGFRDLDDALGLTGRAGGALADSRTGWKMLVDTIVAAHQIPRTGASW